MNVRKNSHYRTFIQWAETTTIKLIQLTLVAAIGLVLAACGSDSEDVPSLNTEDTRVVEPTAAVEEEPLDDEAKVMAFTDCMREQGLDLLDPMVDAEGNVQLPQPAPGANITREQYGKAYAVCDEHVEGLTFGRERPDVTELVDQYVVIATCLRDKGYDVDDPTAETIGQWLADFRTTFAWDDPKAIAAYEECSSAD